VNNGIERCGRKWSNVEIPYQKLFETQINNEYYEEFSHSVSQHVEWDHICCEYEVQLHIRIFSIHI
jgi:hypothetical protein